MNAKSEPKDWAGSLVDLYYSEYIHRQIPGESETERECRIASELRQKKNMILVKTTRAKKLHTVADAFGGLIMYVENVSWSKIYDLKEQSLVQAVKQLQQYIQDTESRSQAGDGSRITELIEALSEQPRVPYGLTSPDFIEGHAIQVDNDLFKGILYNCD